MDDATRRLTALLGRWTNYERTRPDRPRWSLDNMYALRSRQDARTPRGRLVQIGGSKGKGTTALYLEGLARAAGLVTGAYLSPHLESLLERIRIDGRSVTEDVLRGALDPILAFAEQSGREVTFFEVMTEAAVECFALADVDLGILEVGLGGRLDATTAVPVEASILTTVELEHTAILGDTVEAIAAEKAFVVREGRLAFTAVRGAALEVVRAHADDVHAELLVLDRDFGIEGLTERGGVFSGRLVDASGAAREFRLAGAAAVELPALALAYACLRALWPRCSVPLDPVARPQLPGRCEIVQAPDGRPIVLDGAHTTESLERFAAELQRRFPGQRVTLLFGCAVDKEWRLGLMHLLPLVDRVLVAGLADTRSEEPSAIADWLSTRDVSAEAVADVRAGVAALVGADNLRVVTGSFHLVGEVKAGLRELQSTQDDDQPAT